LQNSAPIRATSIRFMEPLSSWKRHFTSFDRLKSNNQPRLYNAGFGFLSARQTLHKED